jgi:hypothetical protein
MQDIMLYPLLLYTDVYIYKYFRATVVDIFMHDVMLCPLLHNTDIYIYMYVVCPKSNASDIFAQPRTAS